MTPDCWGSDLHGSHSPNGPMVNQCLQKVPRLIFKLYQPTLGTARISAAVWLQFDANS